MILPFGVTRDEATGNYRDITDVDIAGASQRAIESARRRATDEQNGGSARPFVVQFRQEFKTAFRRELDVLIK